jgi:hypothetical protein
MKMDTEIIEWIRALIMATTYVAIGYFKASRLASLAEHASKRDRTYRPLTEYEIFSIMALWPIFSIYGTYCSIKSFLGSKDGKA